MVQTREQVVTTTTSEAAPSGTFAPDTTERVEHLTGGSRAARHITIDRAQQALWLVLVLGEILLGLRFILRLLGANPEATFAKFIYGITAPFVAPFAGLFGTPSFEGNAFEFTTLVAMLIYALLAWVIVKVMLLLLNETRSGRQNRWSDTPLE